VKIIPLDLNQHRVAGVALARISRELPAIFPIGKYKKSSPTNQRLRRLHRDVTKLRDGLNSLMNAQHPDVAAARTDPRIYYDLQLKLEGLGAGALHELLESDVRETINGRVPARLLDVYLKIERSLYFLSVTDCEGDAYRERRRGAALRFDDENAVESFSEGDRS
jgi:hypothetical protein